MSSHSAQGSQRIANKIHDHLNNPETRKRLNERFAAAREQLTTSIGEAARIARISPEKARYVELSGILSPGRSTPKRAGEHDGDTPDEQRSGIGHRRYSLRQINRLIIMGDLMDYGFGMTDIGRYMHHDQNAVDSLVESIQASDPTTRLRAAESAYVERMLIPRLMYFTHSLLLGDVVDCSIALVLPVGDICGDPARRDLITRVEDLSQVGPALVGWHSRSHPYCVLFMREPLIDDATRYAIRSVDVMCESAGVMEAREQPTGAYLLVEREFAHLLDAPATSRSLADAETPDAEAPNPRAVAYRLLRCLRQPADEARHVFGHSFSTVSDGMVYSSPEFTSDMTGDQLLTAIADLVVQLGNEQISATTPRRGEWVFSAILVPDNPSRPPGRQSLVVRAQSKRSPHIVGVTKLTPGRNEGLSTYAALSGHTILRRAVDSADPAVADTGADIEGAPGPTLAMPAVSATGKVLAVLYVRAIYGKNGSTNDTFTANDQLLLRVIGHIIGGVIFSYRGYALTRNRLREMIDQPRTVDRFMREFKTMNAFWSDLRTMLHRQQDTPSEVASALGAVDNDAPNPITMLAVDIEDHSTLINTYGSNTARHLIRAVGRRIASQPFVTSSPLIGAATGARNKVYHLYGDRFCLLLENASMNSAQSYAHKLQQLISGSYSLEVTHVDETGHTVAAAAITLHKVGVRIAVVSYSGAKLGQMLQAATAPEPITEHKTYEPVQYVLGGIMSVLDAGLSQAKQIGPGSIVWLDTAAGFFVPLAKNDGDATPSAESSS